MVDNRVGEFRQRAKFSYSGLAKELGISRQSLYAIEAGEQVPKVYLALALAKVLGASIDELFPVQSDANYRIEDQVDGLSVFRACVADVDGRIVVRRPTSAGFGAELIPADAIVRSTSAGYEIESSEKKPGLFIDGCDPVLGIIAGRVNETPMGVKLRWFQGSNQDSLAKLRKQWTHCAFVHGDESEVLLPRDGVVVPFGRWRLALCFPDHNPKAIHALDDICRPDVAFASRDAGSGVRKFLDSALSKFECESDFLDKAVTFADHYRVAAAVALGVCDVGVVPVSVAQSAGLGYVTVGMHSSSFVFSKDGYDSAQRAGLFDLISSSEFARELNAFGGYELA